MQATTTQPKVDRVTVAIVREAYKRTGRHPARDCYRDDKGGACALYVVALMFDPQGPDDGEDENDFIRRTLGLAPGYFIGFLLGFDRPGLVIERELQTRAFLRGFEDGKAVSVQLLGRTHANGHLPPAGSHRSAAS